MRATLIFWLLSAAVWANPPEFLRVKVLVVPPNARFLCGVQLSQREGEKTPGRLRVKVPQLGPDGLVDLQLDSDYYATTDQIPIGLDAPGYAPYLTQLSLANLTQQTSNPILLWNQPVRLTPESWWAKLKERPALPALGLLALAGLALAGSWALGARRQHKAQKRREDRLHQLGLKREGMVGKVLDGLQILEELGSGGMATVYRVEPVDKPGQALALKLLHPKSHDSKFLQRFHREVTIGARLRHPRLMLLHRAVDRDGALGLLMELVSGNTLRSQLRPGGLPVATVLDWATEISQGLFYAHQQGVVHRDLKPDNVMLNAQGHVKVMDFGIARLEDGEKISDSHSIIGTVAYMAPEQIQGGAVTPALDQYAFGIMLFELLTGQLPFQSDNPFEVLRLHLEAPRPDLRKLRPDLPVGVQEVLQKMTAVRPQDRFGDLERAMRTLRFAVEKG